MKNANELHYLSSMISALSCYFVNGNTVDELRKNLNYNLPGEVHDSPEMLDNNIKIIMEHLGDGNTTTNINAVSDDYDKLSLDDESKNLLKSFNSILPNIIIKIGTDEQKLKEFLKGLIDYLNGNSCILSINDAKELEKFREIMKKCDFVVRDTTKYAQHPSSIDSLETFDVYTSQANEAWIQAENCKMFSTTGIYINPITKINELYNENNKMIDEISKLKSQLVEKEKEISDLKKKKPVVNNK